MPYAKSVETKRRLLQTTGELMRVNGYHATGLSEIIEVSGVPKGSLYHHFPDGKEELAAAAIRSGGDWVVDSLRRMIERGGTVAAGVAAFCDHYAAELERSDFSRGCPLATVTLESNAAVEPVRDAAGVAFAAIVGVLANAIEAEGVTRERALRLASLAVSALEGALILVRAIRDTSHLAMVRDHLTVLLEEATA